LFRKSFAGNDMVLESQTCPSQGCGPALKQPLHPVPASWGESSRGCARGGPSHSPLMSPEQEETPSFYRRGLRDPFTSPFIFPPAREKGPAVAFGSRSRILLPHTITKSAHMSRRRDVHESDF